MSGGNVMCVAACVCLQGLRLEMGAALAAGHADLEGREAAVKDAERRLAVQQVTKGLRNHKKSCNLRSVSIGTLPVCEPCHACS